MRKIILFGILITALFLVIGAGCKGQKVIENNGINQGNGNVVVEKENDSKAMEQFQEGRVLVDRVRYVQAGSPPFDFTNVIFHQKSGNGYRAEINSDKNVKVEVMTDKDCILRGQGDKYNTIKEDEGREVVILGERNEGEDRNLCVGVIATGNGQIEVKFKVVELV